MILALCSLVFLLSHYASPVSALNDEGLALLSLRKAINGEGCLANWNPTDLDPCSWHGVTCNNERKVESISISNKKLVGVLSPAIGNLSALRCLNLRNNEFNGSLPVELFDAKGLQSLILSGNSLSGHVPPAIGNLKSLQVLDLSRNLFNGSIPSSLLECKRLKKLMLGENNFSGSIPDGFGTNLSNIQRLNLSFNSLTALIPGDIGNLSSLVGTLDLSHNFFNGSIPESLGNLPEKLYIDLSYNNLSGSIPESEVLLSAGPTGFIGNSLLCGLPLAVSCPPVLSDPNSEPAIGGRKGRNWTHVIVAVACAMAGIGLVAFLVSCWYKKASGRKDGENPGGYHLEEKLSIRKDLFCFMKKDSETFSENKEQYSFVPLDSEVDFNLDQLLKASAFLLGKTGFGIVYKVVLDNGPTVAVRRLGDGGWQRFREFQTEVEAIGKVRHRNIVSLRAYCWSDDEKLLVYDYISNGDLATAIHGKGGITSFKPLSWPVRLRIIKGIARGMAFLHEFSPKRYVHGDLKTSNILLGENMEPQISDFGLSRLANISEEVHSERMLGYGTPPQGSPYQHSASNSPVNLWTYYQAPEASKRTKPSQKWDVYSFGVILLEMVSGKFPVIQIGPMEMDLVRWVQVEVEDRRPLSSIVDPFLVHDLDMEDDIAFVLKLALMCVSKSPEKRPSMRFLNDGLDKLTSSCQSEIVFL